MKTTLLLFFFMSTLFITAQVTHDLNWNIGVGTNVDLEINMGDTIRWTWQDASPHTVTSLSGADSFSSGSLTGNGTQFSYTFNIVGATTYQCNFHPGSMAGTITVLSTASVEDYQTVAFNYSPNPAENNLSINAAIAISKVEIFSMLGQRMLIKEFNSNRINIDISSFNKNLYFAKLQFEDNTYGVFRLIKK